jgi:hypothetical protein
MKVIHHFHPIGVDFFVILNMKNMDEILKGKIGWKI